MGAPHVHRGDDFVLECFLHALHDAGLIKAFNWIATMWGGKIRFTTPMLFAIASLLQWPIAGLTGIMLTVSPFDLQLHDSYFLIAHFHYVLVGAIVFMIFSAIYYWYPKMTGRMLDDRLGKLHFWLMVIGFHVTFDAMPIPGSSGCRARSSPTSPIAAGRFGTRLSPSAIFTGARGTRTRLQHGPLVFCRP